ncbi:hypothetical protein [Oscillospiraceae bacterium]|nr:hypothetical protein [Oscillospiraceae bacterium]
MKKEYPIQQYISWQNPMREKRFGGCAKTTCAEDIASA